MARQNTIQGSFSSGELSPKLFGRVDLDRYTSGVADLTNFIILPQGGVYRRNGTIFASEVKTSANQSWLFPFEVSDLAAYILEMGNLYARFYVNGGQLLSGMTPVELVTPYAYTDLPLLDFTQSADTMFLVHPNIKPKLLTRTSVSSFALTDFNYQDGPYMTLNTDPSKTMKMVSQPPNTTDAPDPSQTGTFYYGATTVSATGHTPFASTDVGRWIRLRYKNCWAAMQITGFTSNVLVSVNVVQFMPSSSALDGKDLQDWRLGSWSNTTGWPSTVTFHEGRLAFGCTATEPDGFWESQSDLYNIFSPTESDVSVIDSDGIGYTIASNKVNAIQWLISARTLLLGTLGSEWAIRSTSTSTPITPTNICVQQQSSFGSKKVKPYQIGVATISVQKTGRKLREQVYDFSNDSFISSDISLLSEHLFRKGGGIVQACYQQEPDSVWWGVRADGTLIGMTYLKDQKIVGFHKHIIGGSFNGGQAVVESCAVIPHPDGSQDQLWLIVKRTIGGQTKRYVEYMDKPFQPEDDVSKTDMNFVDCNITYSGSATKTINGINHLAGEVVSVLGDETARPDGTVSGGGQILLQDAASLVRVGYGYISNLQTMPVNVAGEAGTAQGKLKRIDRLFMRFYQSIGCVVGPTETSLKNLIFVTTSGAMDISPPLYSGIKDIYVPDQHNYDGVIIVRQTQPYPLTILALMPQLVVSP